jgi:hypothetical protein
MTKKQIKKLMSTIEEMTNFGLLEFRRKFYKEKQYINKEDCELIEAELDRRELELKGIE